MADVGWPFGKRVKPTHAWGVVAMGTAGLIGIPEVLVNIHANESTFRWWWPTNWMIVPLVIFVIGLVLLLVPVRGFRKPAPAVTPDPGDVPGQPTIPAADDLTVKIDGQTKHMIEGKAIILEIDYSVHNNSDSVRKITPVRLDGPLYFPPSADLRDMEVARAEHVIEERRARDRLPGSVRPHETARAVWVAAFYLDVPLQYKLTVKDDFDRTFTAEPPPPPLMVTIEECLWQNWRYLAYIVALRIKVSNTTGSVIHLGSTGLGYDWAVDSPGGLPAISEAEGMDLDREVEAMRRLRYSQKLGGHVPPRDSISGWLVADVRRRGVGGTPRVTVSVRDATGNQYTATLPQQDPKVYPS